MDLVSNLAIFTILFLFGIWGIFLNRKNIIIILMSIELMILAVNLNLLFFSVHIDDLLGQLFALLVLTMALIEIKIKIAWTVAPSLILVLIAVPSFALLYMLDQVVIPDISRVIEWLDLPVLPSVFSLQIRPPRRIGEQSIIVHIHAYRYFWVHEIWYTEGGVNYIKRVITRRLENNPDQVDHRLVLPHGRRIQFFVTAMEHVICHWRLRALGLNYLATPNRITEGEAMIRYGLFTGVPRSQAGYPLPADSSQSMPTAVEGVFDADFLDWFQASQGPGSEGAVLRF